MNDKTDFAKIAQGLMKAISTPTDELAARKGEDDLLVQIKRNSDRLESCDRHAFEPQPDWRTHSDGPFLRRKVHCSRCGGDMEMGDAMYYIRGLAHGSGQDFKALADVIWPPGNAK